MKTTVEEISPVKKKILVEIDSGDVDKKIDSAFKRYGKNAKIKGFRPGKVPMKVLERYYGDQVMYEVTNSIIQESLPQAMKETEVWPLNMPTLENDTQLIKGQDFKYAAIMEVRPEFELKDYTGVEVEKEKCVISDDDVDKQVKAILRSQGKLVSISDNRGIEDGDYAIINYQGFEGDEAVTGMKAENYSLSIGAGNFYPGFEDELIGVKKGENKEITIDFKEDYVNPRLAGKSIKFKVEVTDIKVMELPELNDEFVKGLGVEFESVAELKEKIKEDLTLREEKRIETELRNSILEKISAGVEFELPESLVENEINASIENMEQNLLRSGVTIDKLGLDLEKMRSDLRPTAEKNVKAALILGEIARLNEIDVNDNELTQSFEDMAKEAGHPAETIRKYYEANGLVDSFRETLIKEKTLKYLVENASVTEIESVKKAEKE
ncbi:MAG: trigger factor [Deltaproteobacteria bacterium]|nr:trigger factor [Deltaproteobacteria bacterium]